MTAFQFYLRYPSQWGSLGRIFSFVFLAMLCLTLIGFPNDAQAQNLMPTANEPEVVVALEAPQSKEAVRELVARLSDDSVRALLIERLDAVAEAEQSNHPQVGVLDAINQGFKNYWDNAREALRNVRLIPSIVSTVRNQLGESSRPGGAGHWLFVVCLAGVFGLIAERLVAWVFRKRKQKLIESFSTTLWGILRIIYTRLSMDVLGVFAFFVVSHITIRVYYADSTLMNVAGDAVVTPIISAWFGYVVCRFFFAPKRPDLRICKTTDARAMRLTLSLSLLTGYIVLVHHVFYLLMQVGVMKLGGWEYMKPLGFLMNLSMYAASIGVILYNREGLTEILVENKKRVSLAIGESVPEDLSWFAVNWPKIASLLILAKYLLVEILINSTEVGVYSQSAVYITFIVIFLWPGLDANVSLFVAKGINVPEDETDAASKARRSMQQGLLRVGRMLVVGTVFYALVGLWGVNVLGLAEERLGAQAVSTLVELLMVGLIAYLAWEVVAIIIGRWMALEGGHPDDHNEEAGGGDIGGVGLSRVATLLPIIRKTAQFLIAIVAGIMVLNNWGVNIGPIIAGAGVVGLAVGFGAQTLVKDIVSGMFFLADDAFRVGEYIDVGGTMGNVEKISLRSLRLRHHRGLVHTIPYGEIPKLSNYSRDWVIMKLRFRVPFDTDVNKVKKIFKNIGKDLLEDPILGEDFLQPFKSQGVAEVDDNGIVVRGKFMAKPGKQFMIRKEVYVRVQKAFDEADIPFARKQVMVHIPGLDKNEELKEDDLKRIGAAAAESVEEETPEQIEEQKQKNKE